MGIVEEEADEVGFWLELAQEHRFCDPERAAALHDEASQLVAIVVSSIRTARRPSRSNPQSAIRNPQCS
jgi:four helix bundle protein